MGEELVILIIINIRMVLKRYSCKLLLVWKEGMQERKKEGRNDEMIRNDEGGEEMNEER